MSTVRAGRLPARFAAAVAAAAMLVSATACSGEDGSDGKTKLTVATFGEFGYKALYQEYMKAHPNVQIVDRVTKAEDHHKNLGAHLATNTGAGDIEAIEEGWMGQFTAKPGKFVNLADYGGAEIKALWPQWKWDRGSAKSGEIVGLGTDVGGMAMCYRRDLFAKAGLPTERDAVSALWPTWEEYIATGKKFAAAKLPKTAFFDGPAVIYRSILGQQPTGIYEGDAVKVDGSVGVKRAWDLTVEATQAGLSAKITAWSQDWNAGFAKGSFATLACPSWMMAYIQGQAKDAAGKWDVAAVPGRGGNWGGSWLTVPKQSKHPKQAAELAKWLTAPEQQAKVFRTAGNFPSTISLYNDPVIKDFQNPFFNNAPIGRIFATSVTEMVPQYLGPKSGDINTRIIDGLTRVEQGKESPADSWSKVLREVSALS